MRQAGCFDLDAGFGPPVWMPSSSTSSQQQLLIFQIETGSGRASGSGAKTLSAGSRFGLRSPGKALKRPSRNAAVEAPVGCAAVQGDVPPAQPPNKQVRPVQAPSRTARPSNQLKGYELEADRAQPGTKGSTALGPSGGAVQNQSGSNRLLASPASLPSLEQPRTLQQGERRSSQREPASRSRKVSGGQTGFVNAATKEADSLKQHQHQHEQKSKAKLLQAPQLQPQASSGAVDLELLDLSDCSPSAGLQKHCSVSIAVH